jgi:hypothetical protein
VEETKMEQITVCHFCQREIKGKPFIPVHSAAPYHWKCYINKIREERTPSESFEEIEEPKAAVEEEA